jgi:hypothetical protein
MMVTLTRLTKTDLKQELRSILERHQGRDSAITGESLARMVGQRNRQVRAMLEELIENGLPIVSTSEPPAGYFLATSHKEAEEHLLSLQTRIEHLSHRKRKVLDNVGAYWSDNRQGRLL